MGVSGVFCKETEMARADSIQVGFGFNPDIRREVRRHGAKAVANNRLQGRGRKPTQQEIDQAARELEELSTPRIPELSTFRC